MKTYTKELHVTEEDFQTIFYGDSMVINTNELNWFLASNPGAIYKSSEDTFVENFDCDNHDKCYTYTITIKYEEE